MPLRNPHGNPVLFVAANDTPIPGKIYADYVCDGVGDEVEIQAAIDAIGAAGGTIWLLDGIYYLNGVPHWNQHGVNIRGSSSMGTRLDNSALGSFAGFINGAPAANSIPYDDGVGGHPASEANLRAHMLCLNLTNGEYVHVTGFDTVAMTLAVGLNSPYDASTWNNNDQLECVAPAIYITGDNAASNQRTVIEHLGINGGANTGPGVHIEQPNRGCILRDLRIYNCGYDGVYAAGARFLLLDTIECQDNLRDGIRLFGKTGPTGGASNANVIMNCRAAGNSGYGIRIDGTLGTALDNKIIGGSVEGNKSGGLYLYNARPTSVFGLHVEGNDVGTYGATVTAGGGQASQATFLDCLFDGSGQEVRGIFVDRSQSTSIQGCYFFNHTGPSVYISANAARTRFGRDNYSTDATKVTDLSTSTIGHYQKVWLAATDFTANAGAPVIAVYGGQGAAWLLATGETLAANDVHVPEEWDGATVRVTFVLSSTIAHVGDQYKQLLFNFLSIADGESVVAAGTARSNNVLVPEAVDTRTSYTISGVLTAPVNKDHIRLGISVLAPTVGVEYASDIRLHGVLLVAEIGIM